MAWEIKWTNDALSDVDAIARFIALDSTRYAEVMTERFFASVEDLAAFPGMGRQLPEIDHPDYRDWIVGAYRIVYRLDRDVNQLVVVGVVHGARQLLKAMQDRLPKPRRRRK